MPITNPILPGFNADPSICRVGDTYYIATSTFEWYPGVRIHQSTDLENWELVSLPLDRAELLDMRGNPDSGGIWAPSLSYADGLFWLIYTDVKRRVGNYKDTHNFLTTAPDITGPWSDPVYLNSSGFDPSLFHDDDGRKWHVNMVWDHRGTMGDRSAPKDYFDGIDAQEYDPVAKKLTGPITRIFRRSALGMSEGPHLFKSDGWYYLILAEGGTSYNHAVTYARSRDVLGPYELHPDTHVLTTKDAPDSPIQRVGHGQHVDTPDGRSFHTFLCSRPVPNKDANAPRRSPLGREAGIEELIWRDGWPYRKGGGTVPDVVLGGGDAAPAVPVEHRTEFSLDAPLDLQFQWLRTPETDRIFSLSERPGHLRLTGRESVGSWYEQALVARRQTAFHCLAETCVEVTPETPLGMAGLIAYYNRHKFHYLCISRNDAGKRVLYIQSCEGDFPGENLTFPVAEGVELPDDGPVWLGVDIANAELQFRFGLAENTWQNIGPILDASILSDEAGVGEGASFTGNFIGMAAHDTTGRAMTADFSHFRYVTDPA